MRWFAIITSLTAAASLCGCSTGATRRSEPASGAPTGRRKGDAGAPRQVATPDPSKRSAAGRGVGIPQPRLLFAPERKGNDATRQAGNGPPKGAATGMDEAYAFVEKRLAEAAASGSDPLAVTRLVLFHLLRDETLKALAVAERHGWMNRADTRSRLARAQLLNRLAKVPELLSLLSAIDEKERRSLPVAIRALHFYEGEVVRPFQFKPRPDHVFRSGAYVQLYIEVDGFGLEPGDKGFSFEHLIKFEIQSEEGERIPWPNWGPQKVAGAFRVRLPVIHHNARFYLPGVIPPGGYRLRITLIDRKKASEFARAAKTIRFTIR